jgi:hypothetical protein
MCIGNSCLPLDKVAPLEAGALRLCSPPICIGVDSRSRSVRRGRIRS